MYEPQYKYIAANKDKYRKFARDYYHRIKADPEKLAKRTEIRKVWYEQNKKTVLEKQREKKRQRKQQAIEYLGGLCVSCKSSFHPAVYEFHHRDPSEKDRDPSKMLNLTWERLTKELDKCDLLCANCHRVTHHNWECS